MARNKNDTMFKYTCTKIFYYLLQENSSFINEYFNTHMISNLLVYILDPIEDKNIMIEFLSEIGKNIKNLNLEEEEIFEELSRIKIIMEKYESDYVEYKSLIKF